MCRWCAKARKTKTGVENDSFQKSFRNDTGQKRTDNLHYEWATMEAQSMALHRKNFQRLLDLMFDLSADILANAPSGARL